MLKQLLEKVEKCENSDLSGLSGEERVKILVLVKHALVPDFCPRLNRMETLVIWLASFRAHVK